MKRILNARNIITGIFVLLLCVILAIPAIARESLSSLRTDVNAAQSAADAAQADADAANAGVSTNATTGATNADDISLTMDAVCQVAEAVGVCNGIAFCAGSCALDLSVWNAVDFPIADPALLTSCGGDTYIKESDFAQIPGLIVGVILCDATRYKLLLADNEDGPFYEIADYAGRGEDHCEVIGGTSSLALGPFHHSTTGLTEMGYTRGSAGTPFLFETFLGNRISPEWYECGLSIP